MSTPGTNSDLIIVGDTDGLIAILHEDDKNFQTIKDVVQKLLQQDAQVVFPMTTVVETITTLTRKLHQPELAARVVQQITQGTLAIEPVDTAILESALKIFDPRGSKQNTLFDAIVVATANKLKTNRLLSFDKWYKKLGFKLATELL